MDVIEVLNFLIKTAQEQIESLPDTEFNRGAKLAYRGRIITYRNLLIQEQNKLIQE